jgi:hypothetical protein
LKPKNSGYTFRASTVKRDKDICLANRSRPSSLLIYWPAAQPLPSIE